MSGVYIERMEMPRACVWRENGYFVTCPFYDIDGYCGALNCEACHKEDERRSDCPLIPVPDHGRLIDADALATALLEKVKGDDAFSVDIVKYVCQAFVRVVLDAPTVIRADKEEQDANA